MALVLKKKTVTQEEESPVVKSFAAQIDELGQLEVKLVAAEKALAAVAATEAQKVADLKKKIKEHSEVLVAALNEHLDETKVDPDKKNVIEEGGKFQAKLSAKGTSRTIVDMKMIKELMDDQDPELFMKLVKMDLKSVDDYLVPAEREAVLSVTRTNRTMKIERKV